MTRALNYQRDEIYRWRAENYSHHFECRATVKSMDPVQVERYQRAVAELPKFPHLNVFGCDDWGQAEWDVIIGIAKHHTLDAWFINPWYLSEDGWAEFQRQWQELPDPLPRKIKTESYPQPPVDKSELSTATRRKKAKVESC
jgi:hypothetical protein